jgi:hypothetical protein
MREGGERRRRRNVDRGEQSGTSSTLACLAMGVFVLMSMSNDLDRQLIAAAAPLLKDEFQLSNAAYGQLIAVFALVYPAVAPQGGLLIDRVGLGWRSRCSDLVVDCRRATGTCDADSIFSPECSHDHRTGCASTSDIREAFGRSSRTHCDAQRPDISRSAGEKRYA